MAAKARRRARPEPMMGGMLCATDLPQAGAQEGQQNRRIPISLDDQEGGIGMIDPDREHPLKGLENKLHGSQIREERDERTTPLYKLIR